LSVRIKVMGTAHRRAWVVVVSIAAVMLVGVAVFLVVPQFGEHVGGGLGDITHGTGPPWTNVKTGQVAGPDWVGDGIPFDSDGGCGSWGSTSHISWRHGWYIQNWTGPKGMAVGTYRELASLPVGAVFTNWEREGERLWVVPEDESRPGEYTYLYVQRPDRIERWPRADFGCM
jgi:hypothetical protein